MEYAQNSLLVPVRRCGILPSDQMHCMAQGVTRVIKDVEVKFLHFTSLTLGLRRREERGALSEVAFKPLVGRETRGASRHNKWKTVSTMTLARGRIAGNIPQVQRVLRLGCRTEW